MWAGRLPITPYEVWAIFGELIVGDGAPAALRFTVGTTYHVLNGMAFAVAYCFLFGGRHWRWGVGWGLGLEAAMLAIYPGWLALDAVLVEFTTMSFLGHLAYGGVLGLISQRRLGSMRSFPTRSDVSP